MDEAIRKAYVRNRIIAIEHATNLFLEWREELWPNPEKDPILRENMAKGRRDWREMYTPRRYTPDPLFDPLPKKGYW